MSTRTDFNHQPKKPMTIDEAIVYAQDLIAQADYLFDDDIDKIFQIILLLEQAKADAAKLAGQEAELADLRTLKERQRPRRFSDELPPKGHLLIAMSAYSDFCPMSSSSYIRTSNNSFPFWFYPPDPPPAEGGKEEA